MNIASTITLIRRYFRINMYRINIINRAELFRFIVRSTTELIIIMKKG